MTISKELLDELLKGVERPEDLLGEARLMKELKIKLMERMLRAELTAHLGYEEGKEVPPGQGNRRNCTSTKLLKGQDGEMPVAVPRDRDSSFEPELVKKGQTRIDGMDVRPHVFSNGPVPPDQPVFWSWGGGWKRHAVLRTLPCSNHACGKPQPSACLPPAP